MNWLQTYLELALNLPNSERPTVLKEAWTKKHKYNRIELWKQTKPMVELLLCLTNNMDK